jgi:CRISPR system Cascade subunit CasB
MSEKKEHYFIAYLQSLVEKDDRGALASLRRGLGQKPGSAPEMYRYIVPLLPENPPPWQEKAFYLIAALFASHPKLTNKGNLGTHLAIARAEGNEDALERRFTALLSAHPDDLPDYLRQTISLLKSKEVAVNWSELFYNLQSWSHPEYGDRVRKSWATAFWGYRKTSSEEDE